jgi:hypothetical protein
LAVEEDGLSTSSNHFSSTSMMHLWSASNFILTCAAPGPACTGTCPPGCRTPCHSGSCHWSP